MLAQKLQYKYIDVDEIGHRIYEDNGLIDKIVGIYGDGIFDKDGKFDRKKLGRLVFESKGSEKEALFNQITWEHMEKLIEEELDENSILDWILLPRTKYWGLANVRILVEAADEDERIEKIVKRDNLSKEYILLRDKAAIQYRQSDFDLILKMSYNFDELDDLISKATDVIRQKNTEND